jgi:hypothetical protein
MKTTMNAKHIKYLGILGTILNLSGSPLVALLPMSILGWCIYATGATVMVLYALVRLDAGGKRDWPLFIQMGWFLGWNIAAVLTRLI